MRISSRRHRGPLAVWRLLFWTVVAWSATAGAEAPPEVLSLSIEPAEVTLRGAEDRQQAAVTGRFADGSIRDLTGEAVFSVGQGGVATVSRTGVVAPAGVDGTTTLRVEAGGKTVEATVRVSESRRSRPVSYRRDVAGLLSKAGCNAGTCHGNFNGKGGFRLSLRGDDPAFDLDAMTRDSLARRVDRTVPERSLLVRKPTGQVAHEGGQRFPIGSPEARVLLGWIEGGAGDDVAGSPPLTRLTVFPSERVSAAPSLSQQLVATAEFADGTRRDVTRQASYDVSDPTKVAVSADGRVAAVRPGEVVVAVRYLNGRGISRLAFLADHPEFSPGEVPTDNPIDAAVFAKLHAVRINPARPTTDSEFLRRAFLDAVGLLPTADEARAFLADPDPAKRSTLIDRLLDRPEFADFWALKWADLLRNEEKTMGDKGVWVFQRWLRDKIAADAPLDEFARQIVSAQGSTWKNPPASFYRTNRDPMTAAETVGQVFLGVRLQCARCHNHPFDVWTQDDYYHLAAYFGNVRRKEVNNVRRDDLDKHEINGDEVVYLEGRARIVQPRSGEMMEPKPPGGSKPDLHGDPDALNGLADWLTKDNPQFSRNIANRVWYHLMGRGVVDPVDDFRDSNPPSNPALLDALTREFVAGKMRLKPLVSRIMKSRAYALGSTPDPTNVEDEANFARTAVRLLPAEVLLDAIGQALGKSESFSGAPRGARAVQMPGVGKGSSFLKAFGKPDRLLTCECERSEATTLAQALELVNGDSVRKKIEADDNAIGRLLESGATDASIVTELYLSSLSREPSPVERESALSYLSRAKGRRAAFEDLAWAIINSKEFLLRH